MDLDQFLISYLKKSELRWDTKLNIRTKAKTFRRKRISKYS